MNALFTSIPLVSAIFTFCLGTFVLFKLKIVKKEVFLILMLFCFSITIWMFGTFMMFRATTDQQIIFWDKFIYLGVVFIPVLMFHFAVIFSENTKFRKILPYAYTLSFFFICLIPTRFLVDGVFRYQWGSHTRAQFFHHLFMIYLIIFTTSFFPIVWNYYKKIDNEVKKNQAKFVFAAFFALYSIGIFAFLPAYGIALPPFPFLSGITFILILSYAILKHKLLDVKAAGAIFSTFILLMLLVADIFSGKIEFKILATIVMLIVGYFLLSNVQKEAEHAEVNEKLNRQLEKDKKELVDLDRMKDEFLQMATHELNTPITVIQGKLSMAVDEGMCHFDTEQKNFLKPVLVDTMRLSNLSRDILNVARIDQHRLVINPVETDLDALTDQIVSGFAVKVKEKGNSIGYIRLNKALPKLTIDQSKIGEVITNLINNANKFTENGKIIVTSKLKDDSVVISVADTGIGMEQKDQKHLFEKFYQAGRFDPNDPQEQQGSGLGLYISDQIIKLHGGEIWLESEKGKGSTFYFSLPLEYKEVKQTEKIHSNGSNLRVL